MGKELTVVCGGKGEERRKKVNRREEKCARREMCSEKGEKCAARWEGKKRLAIPRNVPLSPTFSPLPSSPSPGCSSRPSPPAAESPSGKKKWERNGFERNGRTDGLGSTGLHSGRMR